MPTVSELASYMNEHRPEGSEPNTNDLALKASRAIQYGKMLLGTDIETLSSKDFLEQVGEKLQEPEASGKIDPTRFDNNPSTLLLLGRTYLNYTQRS